MRIAGHLIRLSALIAVLSLACSTESQAPSQSPVGNNDASALPDSGTGQPPLPDAGPGPAPIMDAAPDSPSTDAAPDAGMDATPDPGLDAGPDGSLPPPTTESAGCVSGAGLPDGEATIEAAGLARSYVLQKPAAYDGASPWPLVLALHPNGGNPNPGYWDTESGPRALGPLVADQAIVLFAAARQGDWRGDLPTELAYFDAVLERLKAELCIDTSRIFSMGFSGGGSFSGVLGCNRTDIRAIGAGGAVIYFDPAACVGTPAAWITIGDGELIDGRVAFREFFREYSGCDETSVPVEPDGCVAYQCPDTTRPVHFCSHPGAHVWPAFGTEAVWEFFSQF